ncbi:MAG: S9 family peptidase, partial [Acidobacteriaceae bacterium]|nr:S9 family peptidase [Acidobacteriaceae bacterium]
AAPPPGENNWWVAKLYTEKLVHTVTKEGTVHWQNFGTSEPAVLVDPTNPKSTVSGLQIAVPRWSPDGSKIAFIAGLMSDQGSTGGNIYIVPSTGTGDPVNLTAGRKETATWISWYIPPAIDYSAIAEGSSQFRTIGLDFSSGIAAKRNVIKFHFPATLGDGHLEGSISIARGQFAFIKSSYSEAPEVWYARDVAAECADEVNNGCYEFKQITHYNDALKPSWGKAESVTWANDGFNVQGWLLYPANYDPAKKYPLVVYVHGGPSSAVLPRWPYAGYGAVPFSALGYFVLMPNPRGSYGEGEKFTQANRKDFGYGDLHDILAGVDTVTRKYSIDPQKVGITGWSYGGFMTMFAVTQTTRFRAAVAGAGISNWLSYYGENSIDQWMIPFFGASVYDDPAVYAKSSAINFIKRVKTPTLVVVGDRDGECPAPQSFEFWHALRDEHVPTELVVYPNEGHGFVDPAHRRDVLERALAWFEEYMR